MLTCIFHLLIVGIIYKGIEDGGRLEKIHVQNILLQFFLNLGILDILVEFISKYPGVAILRSMKEFVIMDFADPFSHLLKWVLPTNIFPIIIKKKWVKKTRRISLNPHPTRKTKRRIKKEIKRDQDLKNENIRNLGSVVKNDLKIQKSIIRIKKNTKRKNKPTNLLKRYQRRFQKSYLMVMG